MRVFNLKGECWVVPNSHNDEHPHGRHAGVHGGTDAEPGRTIYPRIADDRSGQPLRMSPFDLAQDGKPGWVQRNSSQSEFVQRRECDVEDDELRAAREWLAHVEAGRIG